MQIGYIWNRAGAINLHDIVIHTISPRPVSVGYCKGWLSNQAIPLDRHQVFLPNLPQHFGVNARCLEKLGSGDVVKCLPHLDIFANSVSFQNCIFEFHPKIRSKTEFCLFICIFYSYHCPKFCEWFVQYLCYFLCDFIELSVMEPRRDSKLQKMSHIPEGYYA